MKNRLDLIRYFEHLNFKIGAEIGVADGEYSKALCEEIPNLKLYCIDPWKPYEGNWRRENYQNEAYNKAQNKLQGYNVELIKKTSVEASLIINTTLDFVFIDGNHLFDYVMLDIILWTPKVRKGGIVSGHDYTFFKSGNVVEAVNIYTQMHKIELNIISRSNRESKDNQSPCWWFIKK